MYTDFANRFDERVQVAEGVLDSLDFVTDTTAPTDSVTLTLGTGDARGRPDTPVVEHFADLVDELSDGSMRIETVWAAGGDTGEQGVVDGVLAGDLDLGWTATRVWDTYEVPSFQALQAPFLITDDAVLEDVLADPIASEMLGGLEGSGAVGLGLYPDQLRYPLGYAASLASLGDFDGAALRLLPSELTEELVQAFGAEPVYGLGGDELDAAIASGEVDGTESSPGLALDVAPPGAYLTGNVVLFPRVNVLFASDATASSLSEAQRAILQDAAAETLAFASEEVSTSDGFETYCSGGGRVVSAKPADVEALEEAARPVYRSIEADADTAAYIARIRELRADSVADGPTPSCR
jgi:TRAP-type C4-dicarboxylate transport system substrate-binding protein